MCRYVLDVTCKSFSEKKDVGDDTDSEKKDVIDDTDGEKADHLDEKENSKAAEDESTSSAEVEMAENVELKSVLKSKIPEATDEDVDDLAEICREYFTLTNSKHKINLRTIFRGSVSCF